MASVIIAFVLIMIIVPFIEKNDINRGVVIQGVFRSNFILFGIPMTASLYGADSTSVTAILLAFIIPLFNLLSIIALERFSEKKSNVFSVIKEVFKNPLIIGALVALFFVYVGFRNVELVSLLGMLASLTAVSTFTMAQSVKANEELAGQIVVLDSILSVVTIFIWITMLKHFGVL